LAARLLDGGFDGLVELDIFLAGGATDATDFGKLLLAWLKF
jgi:hypothetical protein